MRAIWFRLFALTAMFAGAAASARADEFRSECPADSYVTGFEGTAGAWIDTMRILCARWDAKREKFDEPIKIRQMAGRSNGGNWTWEYCPEQWVVAGSYRPNFVWGDDGDVPVLHSIQFNCRPLGEERFVLHTFGSHSSVAERAGEEAVAAAECPELARWGAFATGISGQHRRFVEGFQFSCGQAPKAPAIKATKPIGAAKRETPLGKLFNKREGGVLVEAGEPQPPPQPEPAKQTATAKADVNIHQEASALSPRIGIMREGRTVEVLGHDPEKDWYRLEFKGVPGVPDGPGWVAASWLTIK